MALLVADACGASLIAVVGTHWTLEEFLDKGRPGMASTFLTHLRVGSKLVNAAGVHQLYQSRISGWALVALVVAAAVTIVVAIAYSPAGPILGNFLSADLAHVRLLVHGTVQVIDFRYHLVSIVAVFLALAIGIVLGSTELQGSTLDGLRTASNSLRSQLSAVSAQRDGLVQQASANDAFLQTAEPKLLSAMLTGNRIVLVTEPGAPSAITSGIEKAAGYAGATVTGTVALQPKFNDLSGTTRSSLAAINNALATTDLTELAPAADLQTAYQQEAAQLIATAILNKTDGEPGLTTPQAQTLLGEYAKSGFLTTSGAPWNRATLAVIVAPQAAPADGANDPANLVLLALAGQFARRAPRPSSRARPPARPGRRARSRCCAAAASPARYPAWTTRTPRSARSRRSGHSPTSRRAASRTATVSRVLPPSARRYRRRCRARRRQCRARRPPRRREGSRRP